VRDAFRNYIPIGQQARMVALFMALYSAAGIGRNALSNRPPHRPRFFFGTPGARRRYRKGDVNSKTSKAARHPGVPEPLAGMLARLPSERGWTQADRDNSSRLLAPSRLLLSHRDARCARR